MKKYTQAVEAWMKSVGGGIYAIDLDGTLAHYDEWKGPAHVGEPVPRMLARVKAMLAEGKNVCIFTARASDPDPNVVPAIDAWCLKHIGQILPVTNVKTYQVVEFWDDRAVQVIPNTGLRADGEDNG